VVLDVQLLRTVGIIRVPADTQASRSSAEQGIVTNPDDGAAKISFGVY
jgi:hypothetical protein